MTAPTTRETADHAELLEKLKRVKYVREAHDEPHGTYDQPCDADDYGAEAVPVNPDGEAAADALENLLSEIAALRGDLTVSRDDLDQLQAHFRQRDREATQAERQRDELRKALEGALPQLEVLHSILSSKETRAVVWREITKGRQALASQGADPTPVKKERAWICPQDNTPCPPECDSDDRRHCASVACNEQPE
ncbi:hypothetical protein [Brevundimonas sp. P7753]|uniref:hypothetical protein n=1 Tax=Brevundimonas sp. P7753 TaxID=2726982 RepID=UPI0015C13DB4|nr:hypothetical protein [Brevundimonas sp. P7753]NWE52585.1 hypothetical protein [Brevundimonas sp. P7753]